MKCLFPPGRSLNYYALMAWLLPSITAGLVCILVFFSLALLEYRNEKQHISAALVESSNTVARRISAELLIGPRGSPESVSDTLRKELALSSIDLSKNRPACWNKESDTCSIQAKSQLVVYRQIPVLSDPHFISVARPLESFAQHLKISNLLLSTLPIALVFGIGLFFQRLILRRYFLKPIQSLVEISTGDQEPRSYWPRELKEISERLYRSFEARDEAVFSQIARGVIHDLRTLIQSPLTATELAIESKTDISRRQARLENLERVCERQLPKIQEIIDTTLDGSREISLTRSAAPLEQTILGAKRTLSHLLEQTGTTLEISDQSSKLVFAHDSLQLERALTNLLKNGIEAASSKGASSRVSLRVCQDAARVTIDIEDSGPGLRIQPERMFRPLKSDKPHGSGLGLVICKKIVTAHGGELIPSRSDSLGGAKFSIVMPLTQEAT